MEKGSAIRHIHVPALHVIFPVSRSHYREVQKVISVSIVYFNLGETPDDYLYDGKTDFKGVHSGTKLILRRKEETVY